MFAVSGTMTNQIALRTHLLQPPHSVVLDAGSHVHCYENGGLAFHSQATAIPVQASNGYHLTLEEDIEPNVCLDDGFLYAPVRHYQRFAA